MEIIGFIRIFMSNTPLDSFFKKFDIPYTLQKYGDNWIYSDFYVEHAVEDSFFKRFDIPYSPRRNWR